MKTYTTGVVAKATGTPMATIQRLLQNHIEFQACDTASKGSGEKNYWSARTSCQLALTIELMRLGIKTKRAAEAAGEFSHRGCVGRVIGELYPLGSTLLVGLPRDQNKVINVPPDKTISDVLSTDSAAFIIDCGRVVTNVLTKLEEPN